MTDVSIIMVNYNTETLLKQCLESVFEKTRDINFEVIVVDNASHDGSQQRLNESFPNVIFVENPAGCNKEKSNWNVRQKRFSQAVNKMIITNNN
jgi:glycosyltransferase involved in cell wall biosynthesis